MLLAIVFSCRKFHQPTVWKPRYNSGNRSSTPGEHSQQTIEASSCEVAENATEGTAIQLHANRKIWQRHTNLKLSFLSGCEDRGLADDMKEYQVCVTESISTQVFSDAQFHELKDEASRDAELHMLHHHDHRYVSGWPAEKGIMEQELRPY